MRFMNESDIDDALYQTEMQRLPNLHQGAEVLAHLRDWANMNSDGWHSWPKPARAADKLMALIEGAELFRGRRQDVTAAQLKATLSPIKAFLTRAKVSDEDRAAIFE